MLCSQHHAVWPVNSQKQCVHAKGGGLFRCLHGPLGKAVLRIRPCAKLHGIAFYLAIGRFGAGKAGIHSMGQKSHSTPPPSARSTSPAASPIKIAGAREVRPLRFLYAAKPAAPFLPRPALEMDAGDFASVFIIAYWVTKLFLKKDAAVKNVPNVV